MIEAFLTPRIIAGPGSRSAIPDIAASLAPPGDEPRVALVITGRGSMRERGILGSLESALASKGFVVATEPVEPEPSSDTVDAIAEAYRGRAAVVIGIGGGSAMDAAKAVAAMTRAEGNVIHYLEGVGDRAHPGNRLPLIACPSTAGTGAEATSNAVLRGTLPNGTSFKKSLRHPGFMPDAIILDHDLPALAPLSVSIPSALDALSQLLEAATSRRASPLSDAFAFEGIRLLGGCIDAIIDGKADADSWRDAQYAACFSGFALGQAGLGLVHGIAGRLGALRHCPHGAICGALLPQAFRITAEALRASAKAGDDGAKRGIARLARAGRAMAPGNGSSLDEEAALGLLDRLKDIAEASGLPRLSSYGFTETEIMETSRGSTGRDCLADLGPEEALETMKAWY